MSLAASAGDQTPHPAIRRRVRLAYFVSHPIQYQTPLLRRIAQEPEIDLTVFFGSDFSVRGYRDEGFGVDVKWDVPLLEGYKHEFLPTLRDNGTEGTFSPINRGMATRLAGRGLEPPFDVAWVHGYATVNQMLAILTAKSQGIPVLIRSDSQLRDRPRGRLKLAVKRAFFTLLRTVIDGVLVAGTLNRQYWRFYTGPGFPLFMLPYAVDNAWFQQQTALAATGRDALRAELSIEPGHPVILFASKLQTRKLCCDLIEAYALLAPAPGEQPVPYLVIVGDGEERQALEQQVAALELTGVRFCGFRNQTELPRFFDLCDVFVLPARHEPWALVVNEVMNAAKPVILSDDVGCHIDLVTQGVEGYVYPVGDPDALADCLRAVLASPETIERMGQAALARVRQWSFEQDIVGLKHALACMTHKLPIEPMASDSGSAVGFAPED